MKVSAEPFKHPAGVILPEFVWSSYPVTTR